MIRRDLSYASQFVNAKVTLRH